MGKDVNRFYNFLVSPDGNTLSTREISSGEAPAWPNDTRIWSTTNGTSWTTDGTWESKPNSEVEFPYGPEIFGNRHWSSPEGVFQTRCRAAGGWLWGYDHQTKRIVRIPR